MATKQTKAEIVAEAGMLWKKHKITDLADIIRLVNATARADRASTRRKKDCRPRAVR